LKENGGNMCMDNNGKNDNIYKDNNNNEDIQLYEDDIFFREKNEEINSLILDLFLGNP
jgi:hypothetical protein